MFVSRKDKEMKWKDRTDLSVGHLIKQTIVVLLFYELLVLRRKKDVWRMFVSFVKG